MPENEIAIPYTEVKRLITVTGKPSDLRKLETAISQDQYGMIYLYTGKHGKFEIKRYRNGRFIKKVW